MSGNNGTSKPTDARDATQEAKAELDQALKSQAARKRLRQACQKTAKLQPIPEPPKAAS